jgi:hypothetical protein
MASGAPDPEEVAAPVPAHPVIAHVAPPQATIYACDCQVTSALVDVLTSLGTEQLRLLHARSVGQAGAMRLATLLLPGARPQHILLRDGAARRYAHGD